MSLVIHCVTGVTVTGVTLWITPVKISISGLMYVTGDSLCHWCYCHWCHLMDNTSEDQYIRSYVFHW